MDRFSSREDIHYWESREYREGVRARRAGKVLSDNPYKGPALLTAMGSERKAGAWTAGWCDADMDNLQRVQGGSAERH